MSAESRQRLLRFVGRGIWRARPARARRSARCRARSRLRSKSLSASN